RVTSRGALANRRLLLRSWNSRSVLLSISVAAARWQWRGRSATTDIISPLADARSATSLKPPASLPTRAPEEGTIEKRRGFAHALERGKQLGLVSDRDHVVVAAHGRGSHEGRPPILAVTVAECCEVPGAVREMGVRLRLQKPIHRRLPSLDTRIL